MINTRDVNIQMITTVAKRLGNLREKVVFVGGCATGLFITDPAMPEVRVTKDVDVIIDITTRMEYSRLEADLRSKDRVVCPFSGSSDYKFKIIFSVNQLKRSFRISR
jgi:hypothetical protein